MLNLIRNEWMKLWSRKVTWAMAALLVVILFAGIGITKWVESTMNAGIDETWQDRMNAEIANSEMMLTDPELSPQQEAVYEEVIEVAEYRLANDVPPFEYTTMQQQVIDGYLMLSLVTLFTVIVAAGIVASEFSQGTIKMLLTRPVKRWKILTSKYIAVLLFALLMAALTFVTTAVAAFLFFGFGDGALLVWNGTEVVERSWIAESLRLFALRFASTWMIGTFAFMLGTVFRSSSLAIGLSIFLMFTGIQAAYLLSNYEIVKYYLFTHTDLTQYETGFLITPDITMTFSVIVLIVYFLIFMAISYWTFSRRDITA